MSAIGSVVQLWRFPVKSMRGEQLTAAHTTDRGFTGDRLYAFVDTATNKVVSAKNPRKWRGLLDCVATFAHAPTQDGEPPPVRIVFPDGSSSSSDEPGSDARASAVFGREVVLRSVPPQSPVLEEYWPDIDGLAHREMVTDETISLGTPAGNFFDFAPLHVLTTSTLAALRRAHPDGIFDPKRFRPNILVETDAAGFAENEWVGRQLAVGDELVLEILIPCPRCVMTTLPQVDLPADPAILRTAARENTVLIAPLGERMPSVGVYAKVLRGGDVRQSDAVRVI